ncbi:MAG: site-specific tyrosine recombinase [Planctomycetota bacterium]
MLLSRYLDTFLVHLEVERGLSPNTIDAYRRDGSRFVDSLPEEIQRSPSELREPEIFEFLVAERQRGRGVTSVRRSLAAVRTFCRFLVRERVLERNPARDIENPKMWKALPAVLGQDEVARLIQATQDHPSRYPLRDRAMLELAYASGLRVSELCGLQTDSIRRDLGILRCFGKGSKERIVPVSQTAIDAVTQYENEERPQLARHRPTEFLFLSRSGKPLGREVVRAFLRKYANIAGLAVDVSPHTLRHSLATHLLRGGADLRVVQEILGHVKVETTEIYTHVDRSQLKEEHRKFHPRG